MEKNKQDSDIIKIGIIVENIDIGYNEGALKYFKPIIDGLRKKINFEIILIGNSVQTQYKNKSKYNVNKFKNALELLDIIKPDLIIVTSGYEFISRSFLIGAKKKKIPSILITSGVLNFKQKQKITKTIPVRINQIIKFGKIIFKKYSFLIKTIIKSDLGFRYLCKTIIKDVYIPFKTFYNEFIENADLYIFSNLDWKQFAIKSGVNEDKIKVVGEYALDYFYKRKIELKKINYKKEQLKILFITVGMVEHGIWKPSMHEKLIKEIVESINIYLKNTVLQIKIHPTAENLENYKKMVFPIDSAIKIIQKGELSSLISESDLIITYGQSSGLLEVLLLNKPIIMINMFNESYSFIQEDIVIECKTAAEMIEVIQSKKFMKINNENIKKFLEKKIYKFDGKCGERAAEHIFSLLVNKN